MIYFIGLQWSGYKRFDWSIVGESACADSWGRALKTREPSLSIPCFAERRYGGVLDDEMLMALPPDYLAKAIAGMEALAKNGLRYPFPQYGIQQDVRAGMAVSYPGRYTCRGARPRCFLGAIVRRAGRSVRWLTGKSFRSSTLALTWPVLSGQLTVRLKNFGLR